MVAAGVVAHLPMFAMAKAMGYRLAGMPMGRDMIAAMVLIVAGVAATAVSAWLQPTFGWRVLWLVNLPTGLALVLLGGLIPESAKFLLASGRRAEAEAIMRRFGARARRAGTAPVPPAPGGATGHNPAGQIAALSIAALTWGFVNFGLLLWLPADLVAQGYSVGASSRLLAESALIACPTVFVAAFLYSRWSTKGTLAAMIGVTIAGLVLLLTLAAGGGSPVWPVASLIVGSNGLIAIILPYAAESSPLRARARHRMGSRLHEGGRAAIVPSIATAAGMILIPAALALLLVLWFGRETRGIDLRDVDRDHTDQI